jgi:hypothetical protein
MPAPRVLRKGAVVRVGGDGSTLPVEAYALSYLDLRFEDGHVERWLGPGHTRTLADVAPGQLRVWGEEVIDEQGACLIEELAWSFQHLGSHLLEVPVEIVVEWNAQLDIAG